MSGLNSLMRVVALLSDFGLRDGYVAQMKGTILDLCPSAVITDISHDVQRHNIPMGSFILETTAPYFPKDTIHVAVVDPGVGSARNAIVVECESALFVGPDNGLMARASENLGVKSIHKIRAEEFQRKDVSSTFHGRDVFAYAAGMIASGRRRSRTQSLQTRNARSISADAPRKETRLSSIACRCLWKRYHQCRRKNRPRNASEVW